MILRLWVILSQSRLGDSNMQSVFGDLKGLLKTENVATDNFVFRLHYKGKFSSCTNLPLPSLSGLLSNFSHTANPYRILGSSRGEAILWRSHRLLLQQGYPQRSPRRLLLD